VLAKFLIAAGLVFLGLAPWFIFSRRRNGLTGPDRSGDAGGDGYSYHGHFGDHGGHDGGDAGGGDGGH
jgi:hypothetical protein